MEDFAKRIANLSPKQLALLDQRLRRKNGTPQEETIPARRVPKNLVPLSFAQERLWFLDQLQPGNPAYNLWFTLPFTGRINTDNIEQSLCQIVRRHEVLRTTFGVQDGLPVQVINDDKSVPLSVADLRGYPERTRQMESVLRINREVQQPFDLSNGPLLRALLLHFTDTDHLLVTSMHHIISDGWSLNVIISELNALYAAALQSRQASLPELPIQYADFALWQREYLQGERAGKLLSYWRQQLEGAPELLNLPMERRMAGTRSFRGAVQYWPLRSSTVARLKNLAQAEKSTTFITLLAGFKALLGRYTGQEDIVVGSPVANRNRRELEPLIGFFVNTLVLRTSVSPLLSFKGLLERVRDVTLDAQAHQDFPFERLVAELLSSRDPAHNPLFHVMFSTQSANNLGGLTQSIDELAKRDAYAYNPLPPADAWVKFDLSLTVVDSGAGMLGLWEYRTDLFSHTVIADMAKHFEALLEAALSDPNRPLSELPMLSEAEQYEQLVGWNQTAAPQPDDACLHELIETQVEKSPDDIALVCDERHFTYRELNERANKLAHYLREVGVAAEKRVGVCMERSPEMVLAILAVLKAGGAYVPLDLSYPEERLAYMVEDAEIEILLTEARLLPKMREVIGAQHISLLAVDLPDEVQSIFEKDNPKRTALPDNSAYVIYTSGSTGKPKGVMIPHRAIGNHMRWMLSNWKFDNNDRILQRTAISFDASVWELFAPLMSGARLILSTHSASRYDSIPEEIKKHGVTVLQLVPSLLRVLLERSGLSECHTLRRVYCGGEALGSDIVNSFYEQQRAELFNLYGPTEAAIDASWWKCQAGYERTVMPTGRPVSNAQIYILDKSLQPVPVGVTGELYIGGAGLARGYLNQPALTAERFIPSPFSLKPGARLYRTGDLGRYLPEGVIEFVGRSDRQVKIRGFRIELAEIEVALGRHPDLEMVAVVDEDDGFGSRRLIAYVTLKPGARLTGEELSVMLRTILPAHMIPAAFVFLDEFPLLPNGKLDRAALLNARPKMPPSLSQENDEERSKVEEKLAKIWAEVLRLANLGIHDNFFALGGHSLLASQVVSRVRDAFGVDLPLSQIFESPTVSSLALNVQDLLKKSSRLTGLLDESERLRLVDNIDNLSEEEIDALVLELKNGTTVSAT